LIQVYESVKPVSDTGRLLWHRLGAKTTELIHEHVHVEALHDDLETLVVDADLLEAVLGSQKAGVKLWEFRTGYHVLSSPAIGSDGTVYVGSDDFKLYAIKTDSLGPAKSPWPMRGQNARHTGRVMKK
jgi:outer membrane protein assembly factor BamB